MFLLSLLLAGVAGAECPAALDALEQRAAQGVVAFEDLDAPAFEEAVQEVRAMLSCPASAIDSRVAVQVHQLMALDAFMAQEPERVRASFRAVLAADPGYQPATSLAPRGNPLRDLFDTATRQADGPTADLAKPTEGDFWVDGLPATSRPSDRPFVLQWVDDEGRVRWSDYLPAGAHLPIEVLAAMHEEDPMAIFTAAPPPVATPRPTLPPPPEPQGRAGVVLLVGAGGAALVSGGLLVGGMVTRDRWQEAVDECVVWGGCEDDPDSALREQADLAERARMLGFAAQGTAGLALGLGLVGGVTLAW